jgi:aminopeptidase N
MADANKVDLTSFGRWYEQAGTPQLRVRFSHDAAAGTVTLACEQHTAPTPGQPHKTPLVLPIAVGLLGADGRDLPLTLRSGEGRVSADGTTCVLVLREAAGSFVFADVPSRPVPSILRGFSAPVKLVADGLSDADYAFLLAHDSDPFNRFEAGQQLSRGLLLSALAAGDAAPAVPDSFVAALRSLLAAGAAPGADTAFVARALVLPSESELAEAVDVADPDAIHAVRKHVVQSIARALQPELQAALAGNSDASFSIDASSRGRRALKNAALGYLSSLGTPEVAAEALRRFEHASSMTDSVAALSALVSVDCPERETALAAFAAKWHDEPLVLNKWLALQASSSLPGTIGTVRGLLEHPAFSWTNPNKVYSLIGGLCGNSVVFHAKDGAGYELLGDVVLKLDGINAQVAARMAAGFTRWRKYDAARQALMRAQMERIAAKAGLSDNVAEIIAKSLSG